MCVSTPLAVMSAVVLLPSASSACQCLPALTYWQVSCPTGGRGTADRYMVGRRSTVRFRKGLRRSGGFFAYPSKDLFRYREKVRSSTRRQNPRSELLCRGLTDAGQFRSGGKISTVAPLAGSFALARERPPSGVQCRWGARSLRGGSRGSGSGVVAASGKVALWSHLAGLVLASPGRGAGPAPREARRDRRTLASTADALSALQSATRGNQRLSSLYGIRAGTTDWRGPGLAASMKSSDARMR